MSDLKKDLLALAKGEIEDPQVTIEVDGENLVFEGYSAKVFAIGALYGMKVENEGCGYDDSGVQR